MCISYAGTHKGKQAIVLTMFNANHLDTGFLHTPYKAIKEIEQASHTYCSSNLANASKQDNLPRTNGIVSNHCHNTCRCFEKKIMTRSINLAACVFFNLSVYIGCSRAKCYVFCLSCHSTIFNGLWLWSHSNFDDNRHKHVSRMQTMPRLQHFVYEIEQVYYSIL